ncbi:MAG TPA: response regulator transcription factor [Acidimicrobiales bacterium]|nr:response regulator transcription factor [Acidimicrobiales bacterium]
MTYTLVVADDAAEIRLLLRFRLGLQPDMEIVGEAEDGLMAALLAAQHRPDAVILDWRMPGVDGIQAINLVRRASPSSRILMYSSGQCAQAEEQALRAGADGFFRKIDGIGTLVAAIRRVCAQSPLAGQGPAARPLNSV